jgi:hypothetical protein
MPVQGIEVAASPHLERTGAVRGGCGGGGDGDDGGVAAVAAASKTART